MYSSFDTKLIFYGGWTVFYFFHIEIRVTSLCHPEFKTLQNSFIRGTTREQMNEFTYHEAGTVKVITLLLLSLSWDNV